MSDIKGPLYIRVDDWTGVALTDVISDKEVRYYNNVTGYQTSEIIRVVGDGSTQLQNLQKRQELTEGSQNLYGIKTFDDTPVLPSAAPTNGDQAANKAYVDAQAAQVFDVINTDSADVAATTPSSPSDGDKWTVINSGTSGNHVTGLPGSISLGDELRIDFIYDATNTEWRYEDCLTDESSGTSGSFDYVKRKYSKGLMTYNVVRSTTASAAATFTFPDSYNTVESSAGMAEVAGNLSTMVITNGFTTTAIITGASRGNSWDNVTYRFNTSGRWKA